LSIGPTEGLSSWWLSDHSSPHRHPVKRFSHSVAYCLSLVFGRIFSLYLLCRRSIHLQLCLQQKIFNSLNVHVIKILQQPIFNRTNFRATFVIVKGPEAVLSRGL